MRRVAYCVFAALMMTVLFVRTGYARPVTDILTFTVIRSPAAKVAALTATPPTADVWPSQSVPMDLWSSLLEEQNGGFTRVADIAALGPTGHLITQDLAFHTGCIVYNIRDTATIQSYYRPGITYWPLHDVEFRHALIHCYDQLAIIPTIYGFIVTPVRSLVPPGQNRYYNTAVQMHGYNPGNPFTTTTYPTDHSSCGILRAAGYTFVDADASANVTAADFWTCPDGSPLPRIEILSPPAAIDPSSNAHVASFITSLGSVGLEATAANGFAGLIQVTAGFGLIMTSAYTANFDAYMMCYGVDRTPDQLYSLLHSNQDSLTYPQRKNAPGINDGTIDALCETVKFSVDLNDVEVAAKEIQGRLYDPTLPNADNFALAYMCLYSRSYFNAYDKDLQGIVKSPGYGSDNKWTFLNIGWSTWPPKRMVGPSTQVIWMLDDTPSTFNPLDASAKYEWEILAQVYDGLTNVNPYNHHNIPWLATDWTLTQTATGMEIDFTLQGGVTWHDGCPFTPGDVEFCLEFLRDNQIPRYAETMQTLDNVIVTGANTLKVKATEASIDLFHEYASLAAMLPPQIWDRTWPSLPALLAYDPTAFAYGTDMAPGYTPGTGPAVTNLFGTGPWIFQFYNYAADTSDLFANTFYFKTALQISNLKVGMFWEVGDYNKDGIINIIDLAWVSMALGTNIGDGIPPFDPNADFNTDYWVNIWDLSICAYYLTCQREYP